MNYTSALESVLFLATKPLGIAALAKRCGVPVPTIKEAIAVLQTHYNDGKRGLRILELDGSYQMSTAPENAAIVASMMDDEVKSDLTQPQLEALTVIAYRGPLAKHELELVRGVNCTMILRNLMMRGLVEARENAKQQQTTYSVSMDFLGTLGVNAVQELPNSAVLSSAEALNTILEQATPEA